MTTALALSTGAELGACHATIAQHSKSFALAAKLLPAAARDDAAVVYAWCRRADDAIDLAPAAEQPDALARLYDELAAIDAGAAMPGVPRAFAAVVGIRQIPLAYPRALLDGMAMDVADTRYRTFDDLFAYCYRVAGVVGLIMCHVMGVRDDRALVPAVHLGIGMQLTNVCRDVAEDWDRGRLYLPDELLARHGVRGLAAHLGGPLPAFAHAAVRATVRELLDVADRYYASGVAGCRALPWRAGFGVRAAARIYRAIGTRLRRRDGDALAGRAVVSKTAKLGHVALAALGALAEAPARALARLRLGSPRLPTRTLELPDVPLA